MRSKTILRRRKVFLAPAKVVVHKEPPVYEDDTMCPLCGVSVKSRKNGGIRAHTPGQRSVSNRLICPGSDVFK